MQAPAQGLRGGNCRRSVSWVSHSPAAIQDKSDRALGGGSALGGGRAPWPAQTWVLERTCTHPPTCLAWTTGCRRQTTCSGSLMTTTTTTQQQQQQQQQQQAGENVQGPWSGADNYNGGGALGADCWISRGRGRLGCTRCNRRSRRQVGPSGPGR